MHPPQAVVQCLDDAHELVDKAISTAITESKPVYISISCNLPGLFHPTFVTEPVPYALARRFVSYAIVLVSADNYCLTVIISPSACLPGRLLRMSKGFKCAAG